MEQIDHFTLTAEQLAIKHEIQHGKGHVRIDALAGCTKTTTLLEGLKVIPQRSILFLAFNKGIAEEAQRRLPKLPKGRLCVVQTFHALGREIVRKRFPKLEIAKDGAATEWLVNTACERLATSPAYEVRRSAMRLVRFAKEALAISTARSGSWLPTLLRLGLEHNLFSGKLRSEQLERVVEIAWLAIELGADVQARTSLDFCDLIWLPNALDLPAPARYQAIMVDEAQDVSAAQIALIRRVSLPTTRIIAAGDKWQQLYSWRGSLGEGAFDELTGSCKSLPLTITRRCAKVIVEQAQEIVPDLRAPDDAEEGEISSCTLGELPLRIAQGHSERVHTFVLSRDNRSLLDCALFLWRSGTKFMLNAGQDLLDPLFHLIDRELDLRDDVNFRRSLAEWHTREASKADKIGATRRREQVDEQRTMLLSALRYAQPNRLKGLLRTILRDNQSGVLLSTVHKVKGLEAERVFLLRATFARQAFRTKVDAIRDDDPGFGDANEAAQHLEIVEQEELNIEYVAITRARTYLTWVNIYVRAQAGPLVQAIAEIASDKLDDAYALHERALEQAEHADDAEAVNELLERMDKLRARMSAPGGNPWIRF